MSQKFITKAHKRLKKEIVANAALSKQATKFFNLRFEASKTVGSMRKMLESEELVLPKSVELTVKAISGLLVAIIYASPAKKDKLDAFNKKAIGTANDLIKKLKKADADFWSG